MAKKKRYKKVMGDITDLSMGMTKTGMATGVGAIAVGATGAPTTALTTMSQHYPTMSTVGMAGSTMQMMNMMPKPTNKKRRKNKR